MDALPTPLLLLLQPLKALHRAQGTLTTHGCTACLQLKPAGLQPGTPTSPWATPSQQFSPAPAKEHRTIHWGDGRIVGDVSNSVFDPSASPAVLVHAAAIRQAFSSEAKPAGRGARGPGSKTAADNALLDKSKVGGSGLAVRAPAVCCLLSC
jgi:hypothetical protein